MNIQLSANDSLLRAQSKIWFHHSKPSLIVSGTYLRVHKAFWVGIWGKRTERAKTRIFVLLTTYLQMPCVFDFTTWQDDLCYACLGNQAWTGGEGAAIQLKGTRSVILVPFSLPPNYQIPISQDSLLSDLFSNTYMLKFSWLAMTTNLIIKILTFNLELSKSYSMVKLETACS